MGRPVITSRIHGCMESVLEGESGFICQPHDANSLYQVLKRFLTLQPEQHADMGHTGRKHMEALFDKRKVVEQTLKGLGL